MNVVSPNNVHNGPVMSAAKKALETGKGHYIPIWILEESENTLKNLLEKVFCELNTRRDANDYIIFWYFDTINRLHSVCFGSHNLNIPTKTPEEKTTILLVERACESGNFEEITTVIPDTPAEEMRQRFGDVLRKRDYNVENIAAGRVYVSVFTDFIAFVNNLRSGSLCEFYLSKVLKNKQRFENPKKPSMDINTASMNTRIVKLPSCEVRSI